MMDTVKQNRFFVDAETDGLYGRFLSVAALVTDGEGREKDRFYGAVEAGTEDLQSAWVRENVLPWLHRAERIYPAERDLLEDFWRFWLRWRDSAVCIADVQSPVEARLFATCVLQDLTQREFLAPFPLFDLSTLLAARGLPWDADRPTLSGLPLTPHDAMSDVRMLAAIWNKLI